MKKLIKLLDKKILLISFIISLPAVWALFVKGFYGASDELHIAWLYEMYETLKLGQFPPRFVPDLSFQHGYPLFNFVFPFPFYIGSLFHFLGFNLVNSIKLIFFLSVPLSFYFMYKLLREYLDIYLSFIGSLVYIYAPFRATDLYVRGAIGEIVAFVFLPLVFLSIVKLKRKVKAKFKYRWIGIGAIAISLLILSHNIVSYMFIPFVSLLILTELFVNGFKKSYFRLVIITFALGFLASIYFWFPAIIESSLMKYSTVFDYWDHFPTIKQLITPYFGYGASVAGPYDEISFFLGYSSLILFPISVIVFIFKYKNIKGDDKILLGWSIFTFMVSIFVMNYRSTFLWERVPFLPYFQFPWRFLTLTTFSTSLMIVSLKYFPWKKFVNLLLIFFVIFSFRYFKPHDFLDRTDNYFLAKYVPYPVVSEEYKKQHEEYLRLPKTVVEKPEARSGIYSRSKEGSMEINNERIGRLGLEADVTTSSDQLVSFGKYYFPGWTVEDNNKLVESYGSEPYGEITFLLKGGGEHNIKIYFRETQFRLILDIISLSTMVFCIYLVFKVNNYSILGLNKRK